LADGFIHRQRRLPRTKTDAAAQINDGGSKQQAEGKDMRFHDIMRFKRIEGRFQTAFLRQPFCFLLNKKEQIKAV